jgi:toxin CptA
MHNAPSVVYPVGRCRFYAALLMSLGILGLVVLLLACWPLLVHGSYRPVAAPERAQALAGLLGALLWLGWVAFAVASWRHSLTGQLQWDANGSRAPDIEVLGVWRWCMAANRDSTPLQQVGVVLDLQSRMLLCWRNTDAEQSWVWVEQGSDPARWSDLRRALVATRA